MKEMLLTYEKTILKIEEHITQLKSEMTQEKSIVKIHELERRIELLIIERRELIQVASEIMSHLAPKTINPSILYSSASGGN